MTWEPPEALVFHSAHYWPWTADKAGHTCMRCKDAKRALQVGVESGELIPAEQVRVLNPSANSATP